MAVKILKYSIPFAGPSSPKETNRKGFYIQLEFQGRKVWAECALPLHFEDHSKKFVSQLESSVETLLELLSYETVSLRERLVKLNRALKKCAEPFVVFAIESLAVQTSLMSGNPFPDFLFNDQNHITLNALLDAHATPGEIQKEVRMLKRQGYRCFKLKIRPDENPLPKIQALIEEAGGRMSVRLDANGTFSFEQVVRLFREIPAQMIDYVEEPTNDPEEFPSFYEKTGIRYALDESLLNQPELMKKPLARQGLSALILKPTRMGILNSLLWSELACSMELQTIFSSNFETNLGLCTTLPLISDHKTPMGFDTIRRFPPNAPLKKYFKIKKNRLFYSIPKKIQAKSFKRFVI